MAKLQLDRRSLLPLPVTRGGGGFILGYRLLLAIAMLIGFASGMTTPVQHHGSEPRKGIA